MFAYPRIRRFLAAATAGAAILAGTAVKIIVHNPAAHEIPAVMIKTITDIPGVLKDLSDFTDGPIRDAVIESACDAFAGGDDGRDREPGIFGNLAKDTEPREKQLLDAEQDLVATLQR